jgi:hypothetical protein
VSLLKKAVSEYLQVLISRIESDEIDENELEKIYNILYLNYNNCTLREEDTKKVLNYLFTGWYIQTLADT